MQLVCRRNLPLAGRACHNNDINHIPHLCMQIFKFFFACASNNNAGCRCTFLWPHLRAPRQRVTPVHARALRTVWEETCASTSPNRARKYLQAGLSQCRLLYTALHAKCRLNGIQSRVAEQGDFWGSLPCKFQFKLPNLLF